MFKPLSSVKQLEIAGEDIQLLGVSTPGPEQAMMNFSGGVGFMAGTLMGVLILGLIQTLITFQGNLNSWWTKIVIGLLVLLFILLQNVIAFVSARLGAAKK